MTLFYVFGLGVFGVGLRYFIDCIFINLKFPFPWPTLLINIVGCFLAGLIFSSESLMPSLKTGLLVGLCGGLTTFSAFSLQTFHLVRAGNVFVAIAYVVASQVLGFGAIYIGSALGK